MSKLSRPFYASISRTCKYYLRKKFKDNYKHLSKYEDQIVILASFLFISSSFMFKIKSDQCFDFKGKSYFRIYKLGTGNAAVICAIRYLLDIYPNIPNKEQIEENIPNLRKNFIIQYQESIVEPIQKQKGNVVHANKQILLLDLVLKVYYLYQYEIPNEPGKVLDLVKYLHQGKEIALEVFRYKAEYILFSFLVNLGK